MHPEIDILMAVYNGAAYVIDQLQSILDQTYTNVRIIIRDNCSSDDTLKLIEGFSKKHPGKITLIKGTENLGAMGNFATLGGFAEAPYVMFSDADDIWLPTKIEDTLNLMKKNEKLWGKDTPLLIHTDLKVVDKTLSVLGESFWDYSQLDPFLTGLNRLVVQNVITGCTMMINKPLLKLSLPIPKEAIMHDWWIGLTASAFGKIDVLPETTILYRQHGKNDTGAKNWKNINSYVKALRYAGSLQGRSELRQRIRRTLRQAELFLQRHRDSLQPAQAKMLEEYVSLGSVNGCAKRYLILKNAFFKNSLLKTCGFLLVV